MTKPFSAHEFETPVPVRPGAVLDILVENLGRVNYSYKRLYIPAPLLRSGRNELLIVETEGRFGKVELMDEPELG